MHGTVCLIGFGLALTGVPAAVVLVRLAGGTHRDSKVRVDRGYPARSRAALHVAPPATLFIASADGGTSRFDLTSSPVRVGRARDNDLIIGTDIPAWHSVSRHHARICYDPQTGRWMIQDEGSRNGVYVDGVRTDRSTLTDGMQLAFGGVVALFRTPAERFGPAHRELSRRAGPGLDRRAEG